MSLRTIIQESPVTLQQDIIKRLLLAGSWSNFTFRGAMHLNNRNADLNYVIVFCLKPVNVIRIMNTHSQ